MLMQRQDRRAASLVRQHLHVAGEHDQLGAALLDQGPESFLLRGLALPRDREVVERDAGDIEVGIGLGRMVGDDPGHLHRQLADPPAIEQVGQAVVEPGDQQHDPHARAPVADRPVHPEIARRCRRNPWRSSASGRGPAVSLKTRRMKKRSLSGVVELLRFQDVAALVEEPACDPSHDPGPVPAGKDKVVVRAGQSIAPRRAGSARGADSSSCGCRASRPFRMAQGRGRAGARTSLGPGSAGKPDRRGRRTNAAGRPRPSSRARSPR